MPDLTGKVAVVAGATRGAGRGIAVELGAAGATVYCTGRSVRGAPATPGRSETIEQTSSLVTEAGGEGVAIQVDHTVPEQVEALFERVARERDGRLDILVNDVWGGDALTEWGKPFWQLDLEKGLTMLERGIHTHIITSRFGAPLMVAADSGLIIEITDGDAETNAFYRGTQFYDLVKISVIRLALAMASELSDTGVTALALTPGFLRSEAMLDRFGVAEDNWRDATAKDPHFAHSETPRFVGRAVAALAADPYVADKAGRTLTSWGLAREYDFDDVDGRRPDFGAYMEELIGRRWPAVVAAVADKVERLGLDPHTDFAADRDRLELRARRQPGVESARWFARQVPFWELFFRQPGALADDFVSRYRATR